jgi:hypothetical protein
MLPIRTLAAAPLLLLSLLHCHDGGNEPLPPGHNVLFVGNSLTSVNDLPGMVLALAQSAGDTIAVRSLTLDNHALVDFITEGRVQPMISQGGWEYVVLQQGPSTVPICRDTLVLAVKAIDQMARQVGAHSIVLMPWPTSARQFDFGKVHESAQMAAATVSGRFAPAGDAWQSILQSDPSLALYGPDGYHPSVYGTYLTALVIYEQVTGHDARQLTPDVGLVGIGSALSRERVIALQSAAHAANIGAFANPLPPWTPAVPPTPAITC